MQKLLVALYCDYNFFALSILENLLAKNCFVNVLTNDEKSWAKGTEHLANKTRFSILPAKKIARGGNYSYSIYCGGFLKKETAYDSLNDFYQLTVFPETKVLILLPFESHLNSSNLQINLNDNLAIVYIGDLLGPRLDVNSDLTINTAITEIVRDRKLTSAVGEVFYPVFVSEAAKLLVKWLFSFGPYGKETLLLGDSVSASDFWKQNQKIIPETKLVYDSKLLPRILPRRYDIKRLSCNLPFVLQETYKYMAAHWQENSVRPPKRKANRFITPKQKLTRKIVVLCLFLLMLPFLTLAVSFVFWGISYKQFLAGNLTGAQNSILIAKTFSRVTQIESKPFSFVPVAGYLYKEIGLTSSISEQFASLAANLIPLTGTTGEFFTNALGDNVYDPVNASRELSVGFDLAHQKVSIIEAEIKLEADGGSVAARKFLQKVDVAKLQNFLVQGRVLAERLPELMGTKGRKSYLVLFQNNMELRPTGGFIGSFGVATLDGGRLTELTVNDVYSADGQLRGHVEPPLPVKDYLGEANWFLRDSNWDPDFPTSAQRAEWFLDKETDQKVDGVIALDLELVKNILKYTGPVFLADYNLDITSENLYSTTQAEVHEDFFPGTRKKASFLTALARILLSEIEALDSENKTKVLASFFESLDERHLQVYMHDEPAQEAVSRLNWSGQIIKPACGEGCYADMLGVVEANVGVNKANYFISRKYDFSVNLGPGSIERTLTLEIKNDANPALGEIGKYKAYVRFLIPPGSEVNYMGTSQGTNAQRLSPEITENKARREVGALIEVLAGQTVAVSLGYKSEVAGIDLTRYGVYFRKQAGITGAPLSVSVLTGRGDRAYNDTVLSKDFVWISKY